MNRKAIEKRLVNWSYESKCFGTTMSGRGVYVRRGRDGLYRVRLGLREIFTRPQAFEDTASWLARRLADFKTPSKRKRIRVVNRTCWKTSQLRKIIERVARDEIDAERRANITVEVSAARQQHSCSGCAYVGGNVAHVRVPTKVESFDPYLVNFAKVAAHELAHCHGHEGERWMRSNKTVRYGRQSPKQAEFYAWVREPEYRVEREEKKRKIVDPAARNKKKIEQAEMKLRQWERKLKLAKTKLSKYRKSLNYHLSRGQKLAAKQPEGSSHDAT